MVGVFLHSGDFDENGVKWRVARIVVNLLDDPLKRRVSPSNVQDLVALLEFLIFSTGCRRADFQSLGQSSPSANTLRRPVNRERQQPSSVKANRAGTTEGPVQH